MPLSSSKSHFSTCPLALEVEITSRSCTISPSLLFMWVISSTSVNNTLAMPSKHFFRWGCTLVERNARKANHSVTVQVPQACKSDQMAKIYANLHCPSL